MFKCAVICRGSHRRVALYVFLFSPQLTKVSSQLFDTSSILALFSFVCLDCNRFVVKSRIRARSRL